MKTELPILILKDFIVGQRAQLDRMKNQKTANVAAEELRKKAIKNCSEGIQEVQAVIHHLEKPVTRDQLLRAFKSREGEIGTYEFPEKGISEEDYEYVIKEIMTLINKSDKL